MEKKSDTIHIVGGGISGLIAAQVLENHGLNPIVIEATDRVGGRVKTDVLNGFRLDQGFQVLLTAYPAAKKYLNYHSLELQKFVPGASIFKDRKQKVIGDPLRDLSLIFSTLFSGIGTVSDKLKILKLNSQLKKKSIEAIFEEKEETTLRYLQNYGFSEGMITDFFSPFFSGIFLETKLETSSRMFQFVYKMFGEGEAAVPKGGIEEIPKQLKNNLIRTQFLFDTPVQNIKEGAITLEDGTKIESDYTIIATEPTKLVSNLANQGIGWKSCETLYFKVPSREIAKPIIGLIPDSNSLINNIFYPTSVENLSADKSDLLSVTVIDNRGLNDQELIKKVEQELTELCGIDAVEFLKLYRIPHALPDLKDIQYSNLPSETHLSAGIVLAGDTQLNGSLNAAMISGERAAMAVVEALSN
ncbi:MAG: NAD(P)/FAD-dependent oxidoreductase [Flavobacteriales bacterium]